MSSGRATSTRPAGALDAFRRPEPRAKLRRWSLSELSTELVARLERGDTYDNDKELELAGRLPSLLELALDVHLNRFSRRRCYDLVTSILDHVSVDRLKDGTIVDLGCGSQNPFVIGFILLMLGAGRTYSVDLEPVQDLPRAVKALANAACWLLTDPAGVVGPHRVEPAAILDRLNGFDLRRLAVGDRAGIAADRLIHRLESVYDLSLADGEADLVTSVSLLEHLGRVDEALSSIRRVTRPGGIGLHVVDLIDHRVYGNAAVSPFEFLKDESSEPLVHGCNRVRCETWRTLFEAHGFSVELVEVCRREPLSGREHRQFVEPYRSMQREDLETVCARFVVRRVD